MIQNINGTRCVPSFVLRARPNHQPALEVICVPQKTLSTRKMSSKLPVDVIYTASTL